jgi:hypothetical protein
MCAMCVNPFNASGSRHLCDHFSDLRIVLRIVIKVAEGASAGGIGLGGYAEARLGGKDYRYAFHGDLRRSSSSRAIHLPTQGRNSMNGE